MSYSTLPCKNCTKMCRHTDKFCVYCGHPVKFYDACPKCKTNRRTKTKIVKTPSYTIGPGSFGALASGLINYDSELEFLRFCNECGFDFES